MNVEVTTLAKPKRKDVLATHTAAVEEAEVQLDTEFFHSASGETFASDKINGHVETWAIKSQEFKRILRNRWWKAGRGAMPNSVLTDLINEFDARAQFDGPKRRVFLRVGTSATDEITDVYIDLCNRQWEVVHINANGWSVVNDAPVRFIRRQGMLPLPVPITTEDGLQKLDRLFAHLDADGQALCKCFLVGCLNPRGPYPLLLIAGEQGTGKSTVSRIIRALIDPSLAPTTTAPSSERDLQIAASKSWLQAYENISKINQSNSDALCRLATGGGLRTRKLYTDDEETIFNTMRPILINSVDDALISSGDLADRSLVVHSASIPDNERKTEAAILHDFESAKAEVFGALCSAVSVALANQNTVNVSELPRMADFAKWCIAGETGLGLQPEAFLQAYNRTRQTVALDALEASPLYAPFRRFVVRGDSHQSEFPWQRQRLAR